MVNMTGLSNITNLQTLAVYTNNATDGVLFMGGIIAFFVIMMIVFIRQGEPFENVFAVSSWSMFIISALFWYAELIPTIFPICFLVMAAFSVFILYSSK